MNKNTSSSNPKNEYSSFDEYRRAFYPSSSVENDLPDEEDANKLGIRLVIESLDKIKSLFLPKRNQKK